MEKLSRYYIPTMTWYLGEGNIRICKNFNMPCYFPKNSPTFLEKKGKIRTILKILMQIHANIIQYSMQYCYWIGIFPEKSSLSSVLLSFTSLQEIYKICKNPNQPSYANISLFFNRKCLLFLGNIGTSVICSIRVWKGKLQTAQFWYAQKSYFV